MGVIDRISRAIAVGDTAFHPGSVQADALGHLAREAPWMPQSAAGEVVDRVLGFGPAQPLLDDEEASDILINGPEEIWVDRGSGLHLTDVRFGSASEVVAAVERAIAPLGLRIDRMAPMVGARLADGSRLQAVLPPASVGQPLVAIRRFTQRVTDLGDLVSAGVATSQQIDQLVEAVEARQTIIVSGGTGAGKTTLLNLLGSRIPTHERVVTVEDAAELSLPGHVVRLEARPPNAEGVGEITIRDLVKVALRLRPDRLIIGEVRGTEALDLVWALNTGHRGSMTTVHANSPEEALWRIETLAMAAGEVSETGVSRQLRTAVDLVCQIERAGDGRRIAEITCFERSVAE